MNPIRYNKGGWLPSGVILVKNKTGKREYILTADTWAAVSDAIKDSQ